MQKAKYACKTSQVMIIIFLPIVILLSILQVYALDKNFYIKEFNKYHVSESTKIKLEDLDKITVKMISYLKDKEKNLNMRVKINGVISEVFGEREKEHMIDVKILFQNGYILRNMGILFIMISLIIVSSVSKNIYRDIYKSLLGGSIVSLTAMLCLFILIQIDFYKYFTYFHKIFFDNNLWRLDPKTDVLIQMLPLGFFSDIAIGVISWFIAIMVAIGSISFRKLRKVS